MSSELSLSRGEFSFVSGGLVRVMALVRMAASSASRSSVVRVSAGGAKVLSSCMGSEPPEAVCSVFAACSARTQAKTMGCRSGAKKAEGRRARPRFSMSGARGLDRTTQARALMVYAFSTSS